ncbi:uncharacterized protein SPSK_10301 [Sporothrix schenckii 1099-18]|uniref:Uncharacterized protein n=1 Tax=Sporothrix schenckii 1099-18 TaxID=1397361 RepID=A0A0F2M2T5_SPOSC|nr:uncharacterized protein SPSK_10301 [Sporothrix schenckii 1099-18]KJR84018.1 hypothetical protein SPSK_10301 [Sporothrix schenckii 1099-18]
MEKARANNGQAIGPQKAATTNGRRDPPELFLEDKPKAGAIGEQTGQGGGCRNPRQTGGMRETEDEEEPRKQKKAAKIKGHDEGFRDCGRTWRWERNAVRRRFEKRRCEQRMEREERMLALEIWTRSHCEILISAEYSARRT